VNVVPKVIASPNRPMVRAARVAMAAAIGVIPAAALVPAATAAAAVVAVVVPAAAVADVRVLPASDR